MVAPTGRIMRGIDRGDAGLDARGRCAGLHAQGHGLAWTCRGRRCAKVWSKTASSTSWCTARGGSWERGMRRRLRKLWRRLGELRGQSNSRDQVLKLGAAMVVDACPRPTRNSPPTALIPPGAAWPPGGPLPAIEHGGRTRRSGACTCSASKRSRSSSTICDPARILFVSFIAYCLGDADLARPRASGLTAAIIEAFATIQMVMCIFQPPTAGTSSCRDTPGRTKSTSYCCTSSA